MKAKRDTVPRMKRQREAVRQRYAKFGKQASMAKTEAREYEISRRMWALRIEYEYLDRMIALAGNEPETTLELDWRLIE